MTNINLFFPACCCNPRLPVWERSAISSDFTKLNNGLEFLSACLAGFRSHNIFSVLFIHLIQERLQSDIYESGQASVTVCLNVGLW